MGSPHHVISTHPVDLRTGVVVAPGEVVDADPQDPAVLAGLLEPLPTAIPLEDAPAVEKPAGRRTT